MRLVAVVIVVILGLLTGCGAAGVHEPFIEFVGWYFQNIDPGYWSSPSSTTAYVNFSARVSDVGLTDGDIAEVVITNAGATWRIPGEEIDYDEEALWFEIGRLRSSSWAEHTMRITGWAIEILLVNGYSDSVALDYAPPGTTVVDPNIFAVYSEDYTGGTSGMMPMIRRANVTNAVNTGVDLNITFTVTDPNVYNCMMWLYDSSGTYIGRTDYGVDWETGSARTHILATGDLNRSGGDNEFDIQQSDIIYSGGSVPVSNIAEIHVILTDGAQYGREGGWDYRSISAPVSVPVS